MREVRSPPEGGRLVKVLDCGAHDGYVSLWLARQLREAGHDVHIDGIELNAGAVSVAQRRFASEGFDGTFAIGESSPSR
jgi:predicted O-methyltransferase YrrM